mmetsp:Transcript_15948/g.39186  ORF Transcript_15948/g.39186 Transcript_15948/m.39186 type:complete len:226 (+) Transcript_15948:222-899(+)
MSVPCSKPTRSGARMILKLAVARGRLTRRVQSPGPPWQMAAATVARRATRPKGLHRRGRQPPWPSWCSPALWQPFWQCRTTEMSWPRSRTLPRRRAARWRPRPDACDPRVARSGIGSRRPHLLWPWCRAGSSSLCALEPACSCWGAWSRSRGPTCSSAQCRPQRVRRWARRAQWRLRRCRFSTCGRTCCWGCSGGSAATVHGPTWAVHWWPSVWRPPWLCSTGPR